MISAQTLCVCREGKPLHTFPDHRSSVRGPLAVERQRLAERGFFWLLRFCGGADLGDVGCRHVVGGLSLDLDDFDERHFAVCVGIYPNGPGSFARRVSSASQRVYTAHQAFLDPKRHLQSIGLAGFGFVLMYVERSYDLFLVLVLPAASLLDGRASEQPSPSP